MTALPPETEQPPSIRGRGWWIIPTLALIALSVALVLAHTELPAAWFGGDVSP